ncbi:hypothetical protein [Bacillus pumilus]|uniref:hypothetical protein n=1 Tax=Bacillus pumilus TaxID=1408 RepID=UPI00345C6D10
MAYENGYDILEYFGGSIEKYKQDGMIFSKALSIINTFQNRSDWPHCIDELDKVLKPVLGDSLVHLGFQGFYLEDANMEWPKDIPNNYKQDAVSFYKTVETLVSQFYFNRTEPLKLFSIVSSEKSNKELRVIRFSRNDGKSIEFEMDDLNLKQAITILKDILGHNEDEE